MALVVGVNSWVTLAYADNYFDEDYHRGTEWAALSNANREKLLIQAYKWIQQQAFFVIPPASTAAIVKQAQCEMAWYIYKYFGEHDKRRALQEQGVTRFDISEFSESFKKNTFPEFIKDMLSDYVDDLGGQFPLINRTLP